jgi:hypothetical protein
MSNNYIQKVPDYIKDSIDAWVKQARPTGGCLNAILTNNLQEAFNRADENVAANMLSIVKYLYNKCPAECWGSKARVDKWKGLEVLTK